MRTFITEIEVRETKRYSFFAGPKIEAKSWEEAKKKAEEKDATLIGELAQ